MLNYTCTRSFVLIFKPDIMTEYIWILMLQTIGISLATDCLFPVEWHGMWYDSRLKEIEIMGTSIYRKGTCIQRDNYKFLMLHRGANNRKCFKCVVFTPWHANLLQYKESPCWHEESLVNVCNEITSEIPLQTVVKSSIPEPCPFQGSYTFSYTNGSSSIQCQKPLSQIHACADETKFRFVYKHCKGIPGTSNQELQFQCLATWENGDRFMYGKFLLLNSTNEETPEPLYRCFMHSFYGTNGDMSMSADATCQGLQSPELGVLTMKLNKDMSPHARGKCTFPGLLALNHQRQWRDLTGTVAVEVNAGLDMLKIRDRMSDVILYKESASNSEIREVFRCLSDLKNVDQASANQFMTFSTSDDCVSEKKCLLFKMRSRSVIAFSVGVLDEFDSCQYDQAEHYLVIPDFNATRVFPSALLGIYQYTDKASDCTGEINIGCLKNDEMTIETTCSSNRKSVQILQCLQHWQEGSTVYVIVQHSGDRTKPLMCLTFMQSDFGLEVQASSNCMGNKSIVMNKFLNYLLYKPREKCSSTTHNDLQSDQKSTEDVGGGVLINADDSRNTAAYLTCFIYPNYHLYTSFIWLSVLYMNHYGIR